MNQLIAYSEACRALTEAKNFDEVCEISNKAEAIRAYALQAKNRQLEIDAAEIRIRAQRRIGELIEGIKISSALNAGGRPTLAGRRGDNNQRPTLAQLGIDRKLSMRSQLLARQPIEVFESRLAKWRSDLMFSSRRVTVMLPAAAQSNKSDHILINGARLDRVKVGALQAMIDERVAELSILRAVADHCRAADNLQSVGEVIAPDVLKTIVGGRK